MQYKLPLLLWKILYFYSSVHLRLEPNGGHGNVFFLQNTSQLREYMSINYHLLPHPGIQSLAPYIPGKSAESLAKEQGLSNIIKLASNENPYGCSPDVLQSLSALTGIQIATYCTSQQHALRQTLADFLHIDHDMLVLANGSDTLFSLLLNCFALHHNKHVLTHDYAFITFAIQAKTLGIPLVSTTLKPDWQIDIDAMIEQCSDKTALIFIANPNNPTGIRTPDTEIKRLLDHIPKSTILILDEAYFEYVDHKTDLILELAHYPNLIITRTFSKAYGLAGLRLGYAIGNPAIISLLHRIQLPFIVNYATLSAGMAALHDQAFVEHSVVENQKGLRQMVAGLDALGIQYLPSCANFITFSCNKDAMPIYNALQQQGIIVRPLHPYGLDNYLRVSIGTPEQIKRFIDTFALIIKNKELIHE